MIELNTAEVAEVSGGRLGWIAIAVTVYDAASDFCRGFSDGFKEK